MRNEDIEILDDFSENQSPNNVTFNQTPNNNVPLEPIAQPEQSVSEFEKMVTESSNIEPVNNNSFAPEANYQTNNFVGNQNNNFNTNINNNDNQYYYGNQGNQNVMPAYNNQSYNNGFVANDYANDTNNDLVQSNGQDLTITAVYPNGFAIDQKEELENTQVIKPKKKSSVDLYLIIIVGVLAITLAVLLVVFYL